MTTDIQEHHNEEEIQSIIFKNEINNWRNELSFISDEIEFYLNLLNSSLIKRTNSNTIDAKYLVRQFIDLKETNELHEQNCNVFQNRLQGQNECDEIECDHAFIKAHVELRVKIEKHLTEVRNIKQSAFTYLKKGIDNFLA